MALHKEVTVKSGFKVSYWKLKGIEMDNSRGTARLTIMPYVSKTAREKGLEPVQSETRSFIVRDYDYGGTDYAAQTRQDYTEHFAPAALEAAGLDIYKVAYGYLKRLPEFAGAKDI